MSEVKVNWDSAQVKDAELTVELDGDAPGEWRKSFEATVRLLGGGDWGRVQVKKGKLRVESISRGEEDKVRFFLESAVEQANAHHREGAEDSRELDGVSGPDAEMTERFRSYYTAEPEPPSD